MHCFVLGASGLLAIWSGLIDDRTKAFAVNLGLGIFFMLNAVAGFILGRPGTKGGINVSDELILKVAPGFLELTTKDHLLHLLLAILFIGEGIIWKVYLHKKVLN